MDHGFSSSAYRFLEFCLGFAIPVCCLSWVLDKWGARNFMASRLSSRAVHELVRLDFEKWGVKLHRPFI
jgi:hypothetical protein